MSKELKKDWLPKLQERYKRRKRKGKTRMLDELSGDLAPAAAKVHPGAGPAV